MNNKKIFIFVRRRIIMRCILNKYNIYTKLTLMIKIMHLYNCNINTRLKTGDKNIFPLQKNTNV